MNGERVRAVEDEDELQVVGRTNLLLCSEWQKAGRVFNEDAGVEAVKPMRCPLSKLEAAAM